MEHTYWSRGGVYNDPAHSVRLCGNTHVEADHCTCQDCEKAHAIESGTHVVCEDCGDLAASGDTTTVVTEAGGLVTLCEHCAEEVL